MEFRLPFSRKGEKPTPENQPKNPDETLTEYLDLLLKSESVSTLRDGNLVVLRTATDRDAPGAVAAIDFFEGETDEIFRQSLLTAFYENHRIVWNVYNMMTKSPLPGEYYEDSPQMFVEQVEDYFGEQLEAWRQDK